MGHRNTKGKEEMHKQIIKLFDGFILFIHIYFETLFFSVHFGTLKNFSITKQDSLSHFFKRKKDEQGGI